MTARRNLVRNRPAPDEDNWMPHLRGYPFEQSRFESR
jgi:hypothetical protein